MARGNKPKRRFRWKAANIIGLLVVVGGLWVLTHHGNRAPKSSAPPGASSTAPKVTSAPFLSGAAWKAAPLSLPEPLEGIAVTLGSHGGIYVAGGLNTQSSATVFRIVSGAVTTVGTLPSPVHDAAAAFLGRDLYVIGGGTTVSYNIVQRLAVGSSTRAGLVQPLPTPLSDLSAVSNNQAIFLAGGHAAAAPLATIWRLVPPGPAKPWSKLDTAVRYAAATVYQHQWWLIGGDTGSQYTNAVQVVDLTTGAVYTVSPLPEAIAYAGAAVLDGHLVVAGGKTAQGWSDATWWWDTAHSRWVAGPNLPEPAGDGALVSSGSALWWIGGGVGGRPSSAIWELKP